MTENIFSGVIGLISCVMCAIPFFIISKYEKDSKDPITFWSGDKTLKKIVKDVKGYNGEMAEVYRKCAWAFMIAGLGCLIYMPIGIGLISLECTVGIYVVWRIYKKVLKKYS